MNTFTQKMEWRVHDWLINSGRCVPRTLRHGGLYEPDFVANDGRGFEVKTCHGAKFYRNHRNEPGSILFSSMNQWIVLARHPDCKVIIVGEGKNPIAIISMSELPLGTTHWQDISIKVMTLKS